MSKRTWILLTYGLIIAAVEFPAAFVQAQTDTIRVVCVGNSITEGYTTANTLTDSYTAQLGVLLGSGWNVKNSGVSGRTMLKNGDFPIWNEQKFKDGLAFNPNIVTICLGTNDTKPWNWDDHKGEFIGDYNAMIDTFRSLPSHPVIWLCLPPPSFSDAFSIRDSVINADIIPMIQQIAANKECQIIDFNTLLKSRSDIVPDGIHPNAAGLTMMAKLLYEKLTGNTITTVNDENCAAGKTVSVSGSIDSLVYGGANLVDGKSTTQWITLGFPAEATIDLGSTQIVDLFRVDFTGTRESNAGYQFRIETESATAGWITALDRTTRTDSAATILEKTDSILARFVRLTVTGAARPRGDTVSIAEIRVLKANGGAHSPVISFKKTGASGSNIKYDIKFQWPNGAVGKVIPYRHKNVGGLDAVRGFMDGSTYTITSEYIKTVNYNVYYAETFLNGIEVISDTTVIGALPTGIKEIESPEMPSEIQLLPSYPNPFNPSTTISFILPSKSFITLKIFDALGREITTLFSGQLQAGFHSRQWNAVNMASGVYFYRLSAFPLESRDRQSGNYIDTKKLVLLR